jgi:acyl dehydratase
MPIDYHQLKNWPVPTISQSYTPRETILYALGLGLGADPLDAAQLRFLYEQDLRALPTMAGVLGYPGGWLQEAALGLDWPRVVHGGQSMLFHAPLPPEGRVVGVHRVLAVVDKGRGRGALIATERVLLDARSGRKLATLVHTAFARGDGGFSEAGQACDPAPEAAASVPSRPADLCVASITRPETPLIYRLSGDRSALHIDPEAARAAGFERPILHGMTTFGIAARALLRSCCDDEPARLRCVSGRFSAPAYPGETLRTEIWRERDEIRFRVSALPAGRVVLDRGSAQVSNS